MSPSGSDGQAFRPQPFGKYFLLDRIAVGGMAEVFRAKTVGHGGFEKRLVIKRIRPRLARSPSFVSMFIDEAKLCADLNHSSLVQVFDFGKLDGHYFIAMEEVQGQTLGACLRKLALRGRPFSPQLVSYIGTRVASALHYAHGRRDSNGLSLDLVHRDVSPSNVLISYSGEVKLADFGIAQSSALASEQDTGLLKGKFEYMSPEQAGGLELTRSSDIFSLGIVLWEISTAKRLFRTGSEVQTLDLIKSGLYRPPAELNRHLPARLDRTIMKALEPDRAHRYASCEPFIRDLDQVVTGMSPADLQGALSSFMAEVFARERRDAEERWSTASAEVMSWLEPGDDIALEEEAPEPDLEHDLELDLELAPELVLERPTPVGAIAPGHPAYVRGDRATKQPAGPWVRVFTALFIMGLFFGGGIFLLQQSGQSGVRVEVLSDSPETSAGPPSTTAIEVPVEAVAIPVDPAPVREESEEQPEEVPEEGPSSEGATAPGAPGLRVYSVPTGAQVLLDGTPRGRTPLQLSSCSPGTHELGLSLEGFQTWGGSVECGDAPVAVTQVLQRRAAALGTLRISAQPGAAITLNGQPMGQTPLSLPVASGIHTVVLNGPNGTSETRSVDIDGGEVVRVHHDFAR